VAEAAYVANRLPALRKGHAELVRRIDRALAGTRLALTGNWFVGVSIEDCLTRSRQEMDRLFPANQRPVPAA
jgi:protoporphyrinogen oxidase